MEQPPIFVKIDQYKELSKTLAAVDQKLKEASVLLAELQRLKAEEDGQLAAWQASLDEVKTRAAELNNALFTK
jgi:uncharacterized protein (DUF342 family)